jgi:hypothetical protein
MVLKKHETPRFKVTVEKIAERQFIATYWDKRNQIEANREVLKFETFNGALGGAFSFMIAAPKEAK